MCRHSPDAVGMIAGGFCGPAARCASHPGTLSRTRPRRRNARCPARSKTGFQTPASSIDTAHFRRSRNPASNFARLAKVQIRRCGARGTATPPPSPRSRPTVSAGDLGGYVGPPTLRPVHVGCSTTTCTTGANLNDAPGLYAATGVRLPGTPYSLAPPANVVARKHLPAWHWKHSKLPRFLPGVDEVPT